MKTFFFAVFTCFALIAQAQVTSTFDTDADGWTAAHTGGTAVTFNFQNSGGNPDGFLSAAPPTAGGSVNTSFAWYWNAPAKFFGDHDFSYGSNFKVDLQQSVAGTDNTQSDIIIYSGGNTLHYNFPTKPAVSPAWSSYSIALDETAGWRWNSVGGTLALKPQIKIVLANITGIRIKCKYINSTGYTSGIDNVSIEKRSLDVSPIITSFTPASTLPGETVTINGSNFGSTPATNIVYFGNVRAEVVSANSSQLTVTVPVGAAFAPISVINTSNSLVSVSASNFLPLIFSDPDFIGNIIPGSFGNNVIVPYGDFNDNGLAGGAMGDIDGDGLLDIVAFEDPGEFAFFLNQGLTGPLTASSFSSKIQIPSGELGQGNSSSTILHDFDNDGKIDIATYFRGLGGSLTGGFAVSRNISTPGNILFEPAEQFYNVGIFCSGMDAADLDGDGLLDFLLNSSGLYYARNISTPGNIEFATLRFLNASGGAVSTKDLNGDGKPEIMVVGTGFNLLENISTPGNIQFATPVNFPGSAVSGITLADLDGDNKSDILYYRGNGFNDYDLVVKKNIHTTGALSAASFDADVIVSSIIRAYSQRVADFNGDGKLDILIGLNSGSTGYGFGVFQSNVEPGTLNTSSFLPIVEYEETSNGILAIPLIGDLNGDFLPDVVGFASSDGGEHGLILYTNQTISAPNISVNTVSPLAAPVGSTVTITGNKFSTDITKNTVWFGGVKAQVLNASKNEITVTVPPGASYERVSVTRDNRTSRYHLPFSTTFSSGVTFDGTSFAAPVTFPVTGADYDVEAADLNGDGKPELIAESRVVTGIIRNYAWSFENVHTSGAISSSSFIISDTTNESAINLRMVDLDEDGRLDILSQQALFRNSTTTNEIEFDNNVNGAGGSNQNWADFDLDGKTDVIAANTGGASLLLYRNASKPGPFRIGAFATFEAALGLTKPAVNGGTAVGDFDNDGFVEFASTNPTSDNMRVWRNTGGFPLSAAQFTLVGDLATGDNPGRLYSGDFDRDGKLDLLLYHGTGTTNTLLTIFHNTSTVGNISFNRIDLTNPSATTVATVADLDGDGKPEIITTSETGNRFSIFKNIHSSGALTAASFAAPFNTTVTAPRGLTTSDLNLDGKPEIIITRAANLLAVYENLISSFPIPTITAFSPTSGPVGTSVTITGTNFSTTPADNLVSFNGTTAVVTASTTTSITVTVPVGATTGAIAATVNGNTATGAQFFCVDSSPLSTVGLIADYTFTGNANDASGNNNNGTVNGAVLTTDRFGNANSAYLFNGNTSFISVPNSASLQSPTTKLTMNAWINLNGYSLVGQPFGPIFTKSNSTATNFMYAFAVGPANQVEAGINNFSGYAVSPTYGFCLNQWYMVTAVLDGTTANFYVNGILFNTQSFNASIIADALGLEIGRDRPGLTEVFNGKLDDIRIYNRALSACEVAGLFTPATPLPSIISFTPTSGPVGMPVTIAGTNFDLTPGNNIVSFNGTTAVVTSSTATSITTTVPASATIGKISVTVNCFTTISSSDFNVTASPVITITQQPASPYYACEGGSASFTTAASGTTNITFQWQKFNGSVFVNLVNNATFSGVTNATLTLSNVSASESGEYQCVISGDFAADVITDAADLVFNSLPSPPDVVNGVSCGPGVVTLTASGGSPGDYRWYSGSPLTLIVGEQDETFVTPSLTANTTYHVALRGTLCESLPVAVTAIISSSPAKPVITSSITAVNNALTICNATSLTLSAPNGFTSYLWSDGSVTQQISVSASNTYSVVVTNADGCTSLASDGLVLNVVPAPCSNSAPVITTTSASTTLGSSVSINLSTLISDTDNNVVLSSLTVSQPLSGAVAFINGTSLQIDYNGLSFTGADQITIRICDVFGECATQTLQITVLGEIEIYNALSPNGDDKNPTFRIEYIEALEPANTVTIFNRWGDVVWEGKNYDNNTVVFSGLNKNGNELPTGTYFYKIVFQSSGKTSTGYLALRR